MALCDTHFHYDLWADPTILDQIEQARIYTIAVTNAPSTFFYTKKAEAGRTFLRAALGLHPQLAQERFSELDLFRQLLPQTRYVGEIGLDKRQSADFGRQRSVFTQLVDWCGGAGDKIMTIHSRGAEKEVLDIIGTSFPGKVILHWYSGPISVLEKALVQGCFFSVNYAMTQSDNGRRILAAIPKERLLTESDGPFQQIKSQPASPLSLPQTLHAIHKLRPEWRSDRSLVDQLTANLQTLLSPVR